MLPVRKLGLIVVAACSFRHGTTPGDGLEIDAAVRPPDAATDASGSALHVQTATAIASGTSVSAKLTQSIAAGDLLVGGFRGSGTLSVSDDLNGAWMQAPPTTGSMYIFYFANSGASASLTITLTTSSNGPLRIVADEFTLIATTNALDQATSSQTNTSATTWTAPATPAVPDGELVYAAAGNFNNGEVFSAGATNGVGMTPSGQIADGTNGVSFCEYALAATAGPQNASASVSPSIGMAGVQATFRRP